jgi:hypothetical protein
MQRLGVYFEWMFALTNKFRWRVCGATSSGPMLDKEPKNNVEE